ncbi:unnamed protein product [Miscanthus lutarioriparius]|uniref:Uncharacterized protein n=1 Tax=Miscanthus lutarioriparius TaxID=422564 RepID=A0A811NH44_9POAL|nr:unnamed protein product [Miscanthus lutarioriparius]
MGISKATGIAATAFLVTSVNLCQLGMRIVMLPFLGTSIVAFVVTFASHDAINLPWILGKNSVGRFPLWSIVLFGPFLTLARTYAMVKRYMRKESVYDKIVEGLYLGGWPFLLKHLPPGSPSIIDCTCHGRSACVVCAILVALGIAENWKDAENIIRERRKIKMNALHKKTLEEWSKQRVSQKKDK